MQPLKNRSEIKQRLEKLHIPSDSGTKLTAEVMSTERMESKKINELKDKGPETETM